MNKNKDINIKEKEDSTKYGEFISSFFSWITLDKQKQKARDLEKMTKKDK